MSSVNSTKAKSQRIVLHTESPLATWTIGHQIGLRVTGGEVIGLIGPLGSGKTVFVQGLAAGMGVCSTIVSPTFVMMNLYAGPLSLCHIDLYRIDTPMTTIGHEDYLDSRTVTAIEWADKEPGLDCSLVVAFSYAGENERILTLTADETMFDFFKKGNYSGGDFRLL